MTTKNSANRKMSLTAYEDIFTIAEGRTEAQHERVMELPLAELKPFQNHPFHVQDDAELQKLTESIRERGILSPLVARPIDGGYALISGHRRKLAAQMAGLDHVPVLVRNMTDDEATILMVDSNIQRENLLPSERAFAYKMKLDAMKRQGARTDLTCGQVGHKLKMRDLLAAKSDDSARMIQRYIRLTELIPALLQMVDERRIAFSPAVEISYLKEAEQTALLDLIRAQDCTPSLSQAVKMKQLAQLGQLKPEIMKSIMAEVKPNQKERLQIPVERVRRYFPKSYTLEQIEDALFKMLEQRAKKRVKSKDMER